MSRLFVIVAVLFVACGEDPQLDQSDSAVLALKRRGKAPPPHQSGGFSVAPSTANVKGGDNLRFSGSFTKDSTVWVALGGDAYGQIYGPLRRDTTTFEIEAPAHVVGSTTFMVVSPDGTTAVVPFVYTKTAEDEACAIINCAPTWWVAAEGFHLPLSSVEGVCNPERIPYSRETLVRVQAQHGFLACVPALSIIDLQGLFPGEVVLDAAVASQPIAAVRSGGGWILTTWDFSCGTGESCHPLAAPEVIAFDRGRFMTVGLTLPAPVATSDSLVVSPLAPAFSGRLYVGAGSPAATAYAVSPDGMLVVPPSP